MTSTASTASPPPSSGSDSARAVVTPLHVVAVLALTIAALYALEASRVYRALYESFAPPTAVPQQPIHLDPASCDPRHGAALIATHRKRPAPPPGTRLTVFMGNSQQFTVAVPRGTVTDEKATITSDAFAQRLAARAPGRFAVYNASAPNLNFVEHLWYALYWFRVAEPKPRVWVIASSFDTYRKAGIRHSFQELLDEPRFVRALDAFDARGKPYAEELTAARRAYASFRAQGLEKSAEPQTFEARLRAQLARFAPYGAREERKLDLLDLLYGARVYATGIKPTSKRHVAGQPLIANWAALSDVIDLARSSGVRVVIYNAPVNPSLTLFYADEFRQYERGLRDLAAAKGAAYADLGDAIPAELWGELFDGPDPIHFGPIAHLRVAELLEDRFGALFDAEAAR